MGRKKKEEVVEVVKEDESKKELETTPNKDSIKYQGNIKLSIVKNGQVVKVKRFHNNGRYPLFQFLSECLRGNFKTAEAFRPKYIALFAVSSSEYAKIGTSSAAIENLFNDSCRTTIGALTYKGTPYLEVSTNTVDGEHNINGETKLTFEFSIPFMNLRNTEANSVALFGNDNWNSSYNNPSAYYFNLNDSGELTKLIDDSEKLDANYSILIEWTMSFKN